MPDPQDPAQTPAENTPAVEDNSPVASPAPEPTTSEEAKPESQAEQAQIDEPAAEEAPAEAERKPSRAERKIRELNAKVKELEQNNQPLQGLAPSPQIETDESGVITKENLDQYVAQTANQVSGQRVEFAIGQERAKSNFDHDMETLPEKYPEIETVPGMEERISQEFQEKAFKVVGVDPVSGKPQYALDPSVRLADIAKNYVDVARAAAKQSSAATQTAVAESADTSAIPPSGEPHQGKSLDEMSIEELEAKVGYHKV